MPAHSGGHVVDAEQVGEFLRVVYPSFHCVEQLQLPGKQRLVPPGQAAEDVVDTLADLDLVDGGGDRRPGRGVERFAYLTDLIAARLQPRNLGADVDFLAGPQPADRGRQLLAREPDGRLTQVIELPDQPAAEDDADSNRSQDCEQPDAGDHEQVPDQVFRLVRGFGCQRSRVLQQSGPESLPVRGCGRGPRLQGDLRRSRRPAVGRALQARQLAHRGLRDESREVIAQHRVQVREGLGPQLLAQDSELIDEHQVFRRERSGGEVAPEQVALLAQGLCCLGHGQQVGRLQAEWPGQNRQDRLVEYVVTFLKHSAVRTGRVYFAESKAGYRCDLRTSVASLGLSKIDAAGAYSTVLEEGDNVLNQAILPVLTGPLGLQATDLLTMAKAAQALGEESDLLRGDLTARSFPPEDLMLVNQLAVLRQELWSQTLPDLDPVLRDKFTTLIPQSAVSQLASLEGTASSGPSGAAQISLQAWTSATSAYRQGFRSALLKDTAALATEATNQAKHLVRNLLVIAGIGLFAILAAVAVGIILGRGLIRQLNDLRQSAVRLSSEQLPAAISRLRSGEEVDVGAEVPRLEPGGDEIGQVSEAFNAAARTAIAAAVDEIKIRQGVNDVFRSLARRNQSLLTRQLQLLDSMERRVHDPEELADLFRVDHMTTRMRRHAEGLLIVAGGSSGRTWREPVP